MVEAPFLTGKDFENAATSDGVKSANLDGLERYIIGGVDKMMKTIQYEHKNMRINFGGENPRCAHEVTGSRSDTCGLLVCIRRKRRRTPHERDHECINKGGLVANTQTGPSSRYHQVSTTSSIRGFVRCSYSFRTPVDAQFIASDRISLIEAAPTHMCDQSLQKKPLLGEKGTGLVTVSRKRRREEHISHPTRGEGTDAPARTADATACDTTKRQTVEASAPFDVFSDHSDSDVDDGGASDV